IHGVRGGGDGTIWFGGGGVTRYDGRHFVNYSSTEGLPGVGRDAQIPVIHGRPDGTMLFGGKSGLFAFDGKRFTNFLAQTERPFSVYGLLTAADGTLWIGTDGGVLHYNGKTNVMFTAKDGLVANGVGPIAQSSDGVMWFGTPNGVFRYDGKTFVHFRKESGNERSLVGNFITGILCDSEAALWFATSDGLSRYD